MSFKKISLDENINYYFAYETSLFMFPTILLLNTFQIIKFIFYPFFFTTIIKKYVNNFQFSFTYK